MSTFAPGRDEKRVCRVLAHYETRTEERAVTKDEKVFRERARTVIEIPVERRIDRAVEGVRDSFFVVNRIGEIYLQSQEREI